MLVAQELETRGEPEVLRALEPGLAVRFDELRRLLNDPQWPDRQRIVAKWDDLLDEIRTRPGFARFLRTPDPDELIAAVGADLLVAVVVAEVGCHAIVVRNGSIETLALPELTYDAVHRQATAFLTAVHGSDLRRDETVSGILAWLWDAIAEPVLSHVASDDSSQRLWWMPTGPLSVLPLAAAGHHDRFGDSVIDRMVSSSVPTIGTLTRARRNDSAQIGGMVIVAMPTTPGRSALPAAADEAREVADEMSVHPMFEPSVAVGQAATDTATTPTILTGNAATIAAVMDLVGKQGGAHFAGHARVNFADPSRSGVVVADGTLTVRALAALDSTHTQLAFLSTCSTASRGGELLDEAVNVASAFELAGYRHVIATMWPVGDLAARRFARLTYQRLAQGVDPAVAVHAAVREIRELLPDRPTVWAAHVHHGP